MSSKDALVRDLKARLETLTAKESAHSSAVASDLAREKAKSKDREWLTTSELATKIGWREHALRDALRGKQLDGVRRTSFGYHIEASAVDAISAALGPPAISSK